eukprot:SAG31_NODE_1915_length_6931_cov_6.219555_3_plen_149_part_00
MLRKIYATRTLSLSTTRHLRRDHCMRISQTLVPLLPLATHSTNKAAFTNAAKHDTTSVDSRALHRRDERTIPVVYACAVSDTIRNRVFIMKRQVMCQKQPRPRRHRPRIECTRHIVVVVDSPQLQVEQLLGNKFRKTPCRKDGNGVFF